MKYISLGNSSALRDVMENRGLFEFDVYYPFDRAISTISVVNDCLLNGWNNFLDLGNPQTGLNNEDLVKFNETGRDEYAVVNAYQCLLYFFGMSFTSLDEIKQELQNRINTLMYEINGTDDLTFIFANECALCVKMFRDQQDLYYAKLIEFVDILKTKYNKTNVKVLSFFVNTSFSNTAEVQTYALDIPSIYISDDVTSSNPSSGQIFTDQVSAKLIEILNLPAM